MPTKLEQNDAIQLLGPMQYFYRRAGHALPEVSFVEPGGLAQPARSLLVHQRDMTSTLARFHKSGITLDVQSRQLEEDRLLREVILRRETDGAPVEYGAIRIWLEKFGGPVREKVVNGEAPLGELIETYLVDYRSSPRGYFRVVSDAAMAAALGVAEGTALYGRSNELSTSDGFVFAEVVEVLP